MSTRTRSGTAHVPSTAVSSGRTRSLTRAFGAAVLAAAVALAFVVWPLAVAAGVVSAFAVFAMSAAVRGAREAFSPAGRATLQSDASARDRRRAESGAFPRSGYFR